MAFFEAMSAVSGLSLDPSEVPIIHPEELKGRERPLMLVDISVPLNVARGCEEVEKVFSYSVDDLQKVVQANAEKRQAEVEKAKKFISRGLLWASFFTTTSRFLVGISPEFRPNAVLQMP